MLHLLLLMACEDWAARSAVTNASPTTIAPEGPVCDGATISLDPTYLPFVTFASFDDAYADMWRDTNFTAITNTCNEEITVLLSIEPYVAYPPYPTEEGTSEEVYGIFSVDIEDGDLEGRGGMDSNSQTLFTIPAATSTVRGVTFVTWMSPENVPAMANELGILTVDVVDGLASTEGPDLVPNSVLFHAEVALDGTVIVMPGTDDAPTEETPDETAP